MTIETFQAAAESLYGNPPATPSAPASAPQQVQAAQPATPAPTAPATATPAEIEHQQTADKLYDQPANEIKPNLPPGIAEMRAAEDNGPYSRIGGYDAMPIAAALEGIEGLAPEMAQAAAVEFKHMAADLGADANQASQFLATIRNFTSNPPTPEKAQALQGEAAALVVAKYGKQAQPMLDLAKSLVERDPRVKAMLDRSGAGNDPRTVMSLIDLAVQQRTQGRLK